MPYVDKMPEPRVVLVPRKLFELCFRQSVILKPYAAVRHFVKRKIDVFRNIASHAVRHVEGKVFHKPVLLLPIAESAYTFAEFRLRFRVRRAGKGIMKRQYQTGPPYVLCGLVPGVLQSVQNTVPAKTYAFKTLAGKEIYILYDRPVRIVPRGKSGLHFTAHYGFASCKAP